MRKCCRVMLSSVVMVVALPGIVAQQAADPKAGQAPGPEKKAPQPQTPTATLTSAKNVFFLRSHGGDIPYETIRTTLDGWNRFTLVNSADQAELIIEVSSSGGDSDVRVTGGMSPSQQTGRTETSNRSSKDVSSTEVTMIVSDAHTKRVLWRGTESAKFAMRQKARENNLVEAAEKLASKFHDRLEPPMVR
jgi:hypothetical protein